MNRSKNQKKLSNKTNHKHEGNSFIVVGTIIHECIFALISTNVIIHHSLIKKQKKIKGMKYKKKKKKKMGSTKKNIHKKKPQK
jgi:hypothetical protein